ncbi:MAG TPA: cell surface protein SprA, partial [Cytophagaceae bacterium]
LRFPESNSKGLDFAYRRAKMAWYNVDNYFLTIKDPILPTDTSYFDKYFTIQDLFKEQDRTLGTNNLVTFDVAYYPSERGQYNFNPNMDASGKLPGDPRQNFGAITREMRNDIDFDNSNIQYIEFWMMSPYIQTDNESELMIDGAPFDLNNTGKLYFNLGNISEDVMKDGKHAFENGLPVNGDMGAVDQSIWGYVTNQQFLTNAFASQQGAREQQDIGLDGLNDDNEREFFSADFLNKISGLTEGSPVYNDPSGDNFDYFMGDNKDAEKWSITKRYKNFNGMENNSPENTGSGNYTPANSTLPDNEDLNQDNTISDFEEYYEYVVDIDPSKFVEGSNYIISQQQVGKSMWYQFRIPIRTPDTTYGDISGFKSIRFMRMYLTGFASPVVLRFAQLQLVANQWRVYQADNLDEYAGIVPEPDDATIVVSTVNVEENSSAGQNSSPYVVPPGFSRDQDATSINNRRLNEQSLRVCVESLDDNVSRAVYKNVSFDFLNYKKLNMFLHAETFENLQDGQVHAFFRLGTDYTSNYYEIEIPLHFSKPGSSDPYEVWRVENELNVAISDLVDAKLQRNQQNGFSLQSRFETFINGRKIIVKGNPDLSAVTTLMIGLRNPKDDYRAPVSVCIWANELRVSEFVENAGWAATARMNAKLADLATVNTSIRYTGVGFGSLDQRTSQRERVNTLEYGAASNISLDKFIPEKVGLKVPLYVSYDRKVISPKYDPLDKDVLLKTSLENKDPDDRDAYKQLVLDNTERKAINLTNLQKVKTKPNAKSRIYDIENLSFTVGYNETRRTSYDIKEYYLKNYKGGVGYNYNAKVKAIEPFKKSKMFKSKHLKMIRDFNFTPLPSTFTFRGDLDRRIIKTQFFESGPLSPAQDPFYEKLFTFNRTYGMFWNLTKSLTLDYNANANAVIDEPQGEPGGKEYNDSLVTRIKNLGRLKNYNQQIGATYKLPFDKIPLVSWIDADARYSAGYTWTSGALFIRDTLGNMIQNTRERTLNGRVNLDKIYNSVKFLKEINSPAPVKKPNQKPDPKDTTAPKPELKALKAALRILMSVKNINFTYSITEGTQMAGFMPTPKMFGLDDFSNFNTLMPFILGSQDANFRYTARDNGFLSKSTVLNTPFSQNRNINFTARTSMEPIRDFKITLDAKKTKTSNYQEIFRDTLLGDPVEYASLNPNRTGTYNISFIGLGSAFLGKGTGTDPNSSKAFDNFVAYRREVQSKIQRESGKNYGLNSQDVLIPAFIAAYSNRPVSKTKISAFPSIPLPNWRIDFNGLTRIEAIKKRFPSISLSHSYSGTYSIGSFNSSLLYGADIINPNQDFENTPLPGDTSLTPIYIMDQVSITERFAPLIGINIRTKNRVTYKVEYRTSRTMTLSINNAQITENLSNDFVFGLGYTKSGVKIPKFLPYGGTVLKNELTLRVDFTIRDTKTTQRKIEESSTITQGNLNWQLKPTLNYVVNQRLSMQFYFERNVNAPYISSSFKRVTTAFGIQLRFTLS